MQLNTRALALTSGICWGFAVMMATWWVMAFGGGATMSKLSVFYFGYRVTFIGSLWGLFWGFIDGLICGYIYAGVYNIFAKPKAVDNVPTASIAVDG